VAEQRVPKAGRKSLAIQPADGQGWVMNEIVKFAKFAMMVTSAALLALSVVAWEPTIAAGGAVLFVAGLAADLRVVVIASRAYRAGAEDPWGSSSTDGVADGLQGWITIAGLCLLFVGLKDTTGHFALAGMIIWFSGIAAYFIFGVIGRHIAGIPLRMGYGGWYVHRPRKKRRRAKRGRKAIG
jgi:hypothetical protein